jgi:hypothetical protein
MRWHLLIPVVAGMLAGALAFIVGPRDVTRADPELLARRREVARLRAHFDSVDAELRAPKAVGLTPGQRSVRVTLIGWLREYREAGTFPRNDRFRDQAMPFFRDSRGVLCAMAYLIDRSGRRDLVDRIALTRNNAFIPELADDPELRAWLDSAGLSVAEAARIQPAYGPPPGAPDDQTVSADYALTSILVSGASLTTLGLNLIAPSRSTAWAGVIAGSIGVIAGTANLDENSGTDQVAAANLIIGGGAVAAGLYRLLRPQPARLADALPPQSAGSTARIGISPLVIPTAGSPRLGLAMHTSF